MKKENSPEIAEENTPEEQTDTNLLRDLVNRREAVSTMAKVGIGAAAAIIIAGGGTAAWYLSRPRATAQADKIAWLFPGSQGHEQDWAKAMVQQYKQVNPNLEIEISVSTWGTWRDVYVVSALGGTPPDCLHGDPLGAGELVLANAFEPLDDYFEKYPVEGVSISDFDERILKGVRYGTENIYGLPIHFSMPYSLVVREDLLKDAGYKVEDINTYDKWVEMAEALHNPPDMYGFALYLGSPRGAYFVTECMSFGNKLFLHEVDKKDEYIEFLTFLQDVLKYAPPAITTWTLSDVYPVFGTGTAASMMYGSWGAGQLWDNEFYDMVQPGKIHFLPIPRGPSGGTQPYQMMSHYSNYISHTVTEEKKMAAWPFMAYCANHDNVAYFNTAGELPPRKDVDIEDMLAAGLNEATRFYFDQAFGVLNNPATDFHFPAVLKNRGEIQTKYQEAIIPLAKGEATPEETYERIKAAIEPLRTDMDFSE